LIKDGVVTDIRSITIAPYALCGFAHIASLAIFVGGFSALAPSRAKDLAQLGSRALYAATLACLMTGYVAGLFVLTISDEWILRPYFVCGPDAQEF
jgi:CNT family concentrative nucleoside transporter